MADGGTSAVIRWGIVGPGKIAAKFAAAMAAVDDGEIVAVASRSIERATSFADRFGIAARFGDSAAMAAHDAVDAVYVATPHAFHETESVRMLDAGKHVLCEKPFALNRAQAQRMVDAARRNGCFAMEAIWSRFLPSYVTLRELLADGVIGTPVQVDADFGFARAVDPTHRLFDAALGGGALLDLGIYPLQLATMVLGPVDHVVAEGQVGATGVDEIVAAVTRHRHGGIGVSKAAITAPLACTGRVTGTDGWIELPAFMHHPTSLSVHRGIDQHGLDQHGLDQHGLERPIVFDRPFAGNGFEPQISEVHRCVRAGLIESPIVPHHETLQLAATMDEIRRQIGVGYPGERGAED